MGTRTRSTPSTTLPGGAGLLAVTFIHAAIEFSAWIAILVVAFADGGASTVGVAVAAQLIPAALLAPVVTTAGDRFPRHLVLSAAFGAVALSASGIAVAIALNLGLTLVILLAATLTVAVGAIPPTVASLVVHEAETPIALMRWNVGRSVMRGAGSLLGPIATAAALATTDAGPVFVTIGLCAAVAAILIGLRLRRDDRPASSLRLRTVAHDTAAGVHYVAVSPGPRRVVLFISAAEMLMGTFDVIFVAVAFDQLNRGGGASALLTAAFAGGGLFAAVFVSRHLNWRLATIVLIGSLLLSLPLTLLGEPSRIGPVMALVALLGAGNALVEIGTQTLLQRTASDQMTSRSFGVVDSAALIAAAIGAGAAGVVIDGSDLTLVLALIGMVAAGILLVGTFGLRRTERAESVDIELVDAVGSVRFLAVLPLPTIERLTHSITVRQVDAGVSLIVQGDKGDEFFILLDGAVDIEIDGTVVDRQRSPSSFGEIALLHDEARTATVTTTERSRVAVIDRIVFIDTVTRVPISHRAALDAALQYRRPAG